MKSHKIYIFAGIVLGTLSIASHTHTAAEWSAAEEAAHRLMIETTGRLGTVINEGYENPGVNRALEQRAAEALSQGALLNIPHTHTGNTFLHIARNGTIAALLIQHNAPLETKNKFDETPLQHVALRYLCYGEVGDLETVEVLLSSGANMHAQNENMPNGLYNSLLNDSSLNEADSATYGFTQQMIDYAKQMVSLFQTQINNQ